jgi:hypothetical protein
MVYGVVFTALLTGMAAAQVIGIDSFDYPNGSPGGLAGGEYWMWNNIAKTHTNGKSAWNVLWGNVVLNNKAIYTTDGGALRDYGANRNDAAFRAAGVVYYRVQFTALGDQGWCGMSGYDFGSERIFFGMPGGQGDVPLGKFGIEISGGSKYLSATSVTRDQVYLLLCAIDFDGDQVRMWINPDADDWDNGAANNSADVKGTYTGTNWNTGVRLASGGPCRWDDVMVANTFWDLVPKTAKTPSPTNGQMFVPLNVTLSWDPARDPANPAAPNPAITAHRLYTNFANPADPNLYFIGQIPNTGNRAESGPFSLERDKVYFWRVDQVLSDANDIVGTVWRFESEKSVPVVNGQPKAQLVWAGETASFNVAVTSVSPPSYQWYKYVDGLTDIQLTDGGNIFGAQAETLSIVNVQLANEGEYYCVVSNASGMSDTSKRALLAVYRKLAYWSFDGNNPQSIIPGSPATVIYGTPEFTAGVVGDAMAFDAGLDLLYTDPNDTTYFNSCNYSMTVACWVQTTTAQTWNPFVARHGEDGQGWQLRQGSVAGRPTFTTRGTGNDDGTRGDRTVADGKWHYVVGTFDGSAKKLYIDGVISRYYSVDTGAMLRDSDAVSGTINPTVSPVAIAGRVRSLPAELVIEYWNVVGAKYDEVEVYNYALDAATIAQKYADISGTTVCTVPQAYDLDGDCVVDLNDFARLASEWLNSTRIQPTL